MPPPPRPAPLPSSARQYRMDDPRELLCLAASDSLGMVAAGGLAAVALLDPRAERPAARLKHHDKLGVRSLSLNGDILGCGGASGALHLFDVRAGRWVPQLGSRKELLALAADARCIQQDANYRCRGAGMHACRKWSSGLLAAVEGVARRMGAPQRAMT